MSDLWDTIGKHVDRDALRRALTAHFAPAQNVQSAPVQNAPIAPKDPSRDAILGKLVLSDVLDDPITAARPDSPSFPLRLFFGELAARLADERGFVLAAGLSFYFRAEIEEDSRALLGVEVSRAFYDFSLEPELRRRVGPLLASLMSTALHHSQLFSVEDARVFDSATMERARGTDLSAASPVHARSFGLRVVASGLCKRKALVATGREG